MTRKSKLKRINCVSTRGLGGHPPKDRCDAKKGPQTKPKVWVNAMSAGSAKFIPTKI